MFSNETPIPSIPVDCFLHKVGITDHTMYINLNNKPGTDKINKKGIESGRFMGEDKVIKGYAILNKNDVIKLKEYKDNKLKLPLMETEGFLGYGMYFVIENLSLAKYLAKKQNQTVIIGADIDLNRCLNLFKNEGQSQLSIILNELISKGESITDSKLLDNLLKMSTTVYDSILGFCGYEPLYSGSTIYKFMGKVACIKNRDCIIKYFRI